MKLIWQNASHIFSLIFWQLVPQEQRLAYPSVMSDLLAEVSDHYVKELRKGTVDMMVRKPENEREEEKVESIQESV